MKKTHPHPLRDVFHPLDLTQGKDPRDLMPRWLLRTGGGDCTPPANPLTSATPCRWEEDTHPDLLSKLPESIDFAQATDKEKGHPQEPDGWQEEAELREQARQRYPYPACNLWGSVPPEYVEDCKEVDRQRKEWIREQKAMGKPTQNPEETHSKPMGSANGVQLTDTERQDVTRDHVGQGPVLIHPYEGQYFTNDTINPTPQACTVKENRAEERWRRLEEERKGRAETAIVGERGKEGRLDPQRPKIPPFPPGGYIPSLEEGLIPKSIQEAIRKATEDLRTLDKAMTRPRRLRLEDLTLTDLWTLEKLLRRRRRQLKGQPAALATVDHQILALTTHFNHRVNQIDL